MNFFGTKTVAKMLQVSITMLQQAIWHERLQPPPVKGPGGAFLWTLEDVERASWQLLGRPYEPQGEEVTCHDTKRHG